MTIRQYRQQYLKYRYLNDIKTELNNDKTPIEIDQDEETENENENETDGLLQESTTNVTQKQKQTYNINIESKYYGLSFHDPNLSKSEKKCLINLFIFVRLEWLWYIIYVSIIVYHYLNQSTQLQDDVLLPSFEDIATGYIDSITMMFHRGFTNATTYKLLHDNCHKNRVSILVAFGNRLVPLILNSIYLIKIFISMNNNDNQNVYITLSFLMIIYALFIDSCFMRFYYRMYYGFAIDQIEDTAELKETQFYYPRPTMWSMYIIDLTLIKNENDCDINMRNTIKNNKKYAFAISISSIIIGFIIVFVENMIIITIYTFYSPIIEPFNWRLLNHIILWGMHVSVIFFVSFVLSTRFANTWSLFKEGTLVLSVLFFIVLIIPSSYGIFKTESSNYTWMTYTVLCLTIIKVICYLIYIISLCLYQEVDQTIFYKVYTIKNKSNVTNTDQVSYRNNENKFYLNRKKIINFVIILCIYAFSYILVSDWNGNIFINTNYDRYNWSVLGGGTPGYSVLFHEGFLLMAFCFDICVYNKEWAPGYDISKYSLLCIITLITWQMGNFIVYGICFGIDIFLQKISPFVLICAVLWIIYLCDILKMILKVNTLFPHSSGFSVSYLQFYKSLNDNRIV